MKLLPTGLIAGSILLGFVAPRPLDPQGLVHAIVGVVEADIARHPPSQHYQMDGPRYIDVSSFAQRIHEATGETVFTADVPAESGPKAVLATREEAVLNTGERVRGGGVFIRLDSLRVVREGSDRLVAFVRWEFTAFRAGEPYVYPMAIRLCLDPLPKGWTVVESRQVPTVLFPSPPPLLACELQ